MHNNRVITDPKAISDGFNNYFVDIGPTLASKIPNNNISHRRFLPENLNFSLFLEPTDETEIKNIINKLKEGASHIPLQIWLTYHSSKVFFLMNLKLL